MGISEKTVITREEVMEFIPQRAPIVMVDKFFGITENTSRSALTISEENIFCESGEFNECGVIEHIAQSAAMRVGYICKCEGKEIPLGYIGSVNKCRIIRLPKVGETLFTEINIEQEVMNISLISAVVRIGDEVVAECLMKIYLQA